ncbi:hypothetical protein APY04_0186 [Hyphomicrobium sulfonivorans]|uniref:Phage protein n=2 Tax=Hyphomicrobium sulfonivorans TaxID=121290 RepID=A0A109BQL5_HYPSL|nr:hypothetical protein APY04_0186 [Hyphomicrobium sulfonivorans]
MISMDEKTLTELLRKYPTTMHGDDGKTVITCVARLSFVHFKEPRRGDNPSSKPMYGCAAILPPAADVSLLRSICEKAWSDRKCVSRTEPKAKPLKKQADNTKWEGFGDEGFYFNCSTINPVDLFNLDMTRAPVDKFYSGCWGRLKIHSYDFDKGLNWGVSLGLQAVQFFADDEKLGGGGNAADGFEAHGNAVNGSRPAQMPATGADSVW